MKQTLSQSASAKAVGILLLATLFWGTSFYPTAVILKSLSEGEYLLLRFVLACFIFAGLSFRQIKAASLSQALRGLIVGLILGAAFLTQTLAFSGASSSIIAFLTSTTIIFVPLLSWALFKIKPSLKMSIAALIALVGLYFLSGAALLAGNLGEILALSCALFFGAHISFSEHFLKTCELRAFVFYQFLGASIFLAASLPALNLRFELASFDLASVLFCLYGAVVLTVFCFFAQNYAQQHLSAAKVAILLAFEPLSAGVLGAAMGESLGASGYLGAALIIIGVIFS